MKEGGRVHPIKNIDLFCRPFENVFPNMNLSFSLSKIATRINEKKILFIVAEVS